MPTIKSTRTYGPKSSPSSVRVKSRNWCWTLNNYTPEDILKLDAFCVLKANVYVIYGKEVGDGTSKGPSITRSVPNGTPHLQGYTHFPSPMAASAMKKLLPRAHIEVCKGTPQDNIIYCSKGGDVTTYGAEPKTQQQVQKDKAKLFIELAQAGDFASIQAVMPAKYAQMYRTMHQIYADHQKAPAPLDTTCGIWIYGETGCGKTTSARKDYGTVFLKSCNKWWDGYDGQDSAVLEDMDPGHSKLAHHIKLWADKWSFNCEVKGGTRCIRPKRFIVTSNHSIEEVFYDCKPQDLEAIKRRFRVIHMHRRLGNGAEGYVRTVVPAPAHGQLLLDEHGDLIPSTVYPVLDIPSFMDNIDPPPDDDEANETAMAATMIDSDTDEDEIEESSDEEIFVDKDPIEESSDEEIFVTHVKLPPKK
jgi:hypothetical protein